MSDDKLMELFASYTAWVNFAATELAGAELSEAKLESHLHWIQATKMVSSWGDNPKNLVTVAKAERDIDPDVIKASDELVVAKAQRKMTGVIYENCERCVFLISRELTRRIGRDGSDKRVGRYRP